MADDTTSSYGDHFDPSMFLSLPLFARVSLDLLTPLLTEDAVRYYQDGETMLSQGDPAHHLLILLHGQARVLTDGIYLVTRHPYEVIGELAFINQTARNASVIAQGTVRALFLPASLVEHLLENAIFTRNLLHLVAEKLNEATQERAFRFRHEALLFSEFRAHLSPVIAQRLLVTGKQYGTPRFIDAVVSVIHQHEGMIDKFIEDAVFALWGIAPTQQDPVELAFACAKAMLHLSAKFSFGGEPLQLGIGLNAGRVFSGNVGNEEKRQFTVLGHPVNLAARYEGATKELRAPIVVGETFAH